MASVARLNPPEILRLSRDQQRRSQKKKTVLPCLILTAAFAFYMASLLGTLAAPSGWVSVPLSAICGLAIGLLFIIGHDACHQSYMPSRLANHLIGRLAFLPSLHPFSLWDLGHNRTHHRFNNIRGKDYVWEPITPDEYSDLSFGARLLYRFVRTPIGVPFYYGVEIWAKRMFFVLPWKMAGSRKAYWLDVLTIWLFVPLHAYAVISLGILFGKSPAYALGLGLLLPFAVWNGLMSFVIYLHHIHPEIPWYQSIEAWRSGEGKIRGTAHVQFPFLVEKLLLHIMEHNAHHFAPGVPLYNLVPLQRVVERGRVTSWRWSPREFRHVCRECKLFDYDAGQWRRFGSA